MIRIIALIGMLSLLGAAETDNLNAAKKFYAARCAACHGDKGKGDGAASAALKPRPRDFSDAKYWLKADDATIIKIIREGGAKHKLSPLMPPHQDLKPEVAVQMVTLLRSFAPKPTKEKSKSELADEK